MIPKKDPPGEVAITATGRWHYTPIPAGTKAQGFLAGYPFWVPIHRVGVTKPCKTEITDGDLKCDYCSPTLKAEWRGYLPWYSAEYLKCTCWVSLSHREAIEEIGEHEMIELFRPKNPKEPVHVVAKPWRTTPLPAHRSRVWPVDISPALLVLWKDQELIRWCHERAKAGGAKADTPAGRAITRELLAHLGDGAGDGASDTPVSPADRNEAFARAARGARPGKNGQH